MTWWQILVISLAAVFTNVLSFYLGCARGYRVAEEDMEDRR